MLATSQENRRYRKEAYMGIEITSVGSSSSGNSYIIRSEEAAVILDVGLSGKKIKAALSDLGVELSEIKALMITHEHIDHVNSIRMMAKACPNAVVVTSQGTYDACPKMQEVDDERIRFVKSGDNLRLSDIEVNVFALSHDAAEPIGYSVASGDDRATIVTDTGIVTDDMRHELVRANKLVFESNYEDNYLMMGPYPYSVKLRIQSEYGHLSNELAGKTLSEILSHKKRMSDVTKAPKIMLAHLSTTNNTAMQAKDTVNTIMQKNGYTDGADFHMIIAAKEGMTKL